jgi:hypothetical protein
MRGFPDAAVACLGAGGGVLSPGTKSNIGRIFSSTLLRSASCLPSGRGIHVPKSISLARMRVAFNSTCCICTLVFSVSTLHLLMHTFLYLTLEDPSSTGFIIFRDLQDVSSVDPVVGSASHTVVAFAVELVDRDLDKGIRGWTFLTLMIEEPTLLYVAEYTLSDMLGDRGDCESSTAIDSDAPEAQLDATALKGCQSSFLAIMYDRGHVRKGRVPSWCHALV